MKRAYTKEIMDQLYTQPEYARMVMETQSNIIIGMNKLARMGNFTYDETLFGPQEIQYNKE